MRCWCALLVMIVLGLVSVNAGAQTHASVAEQYLFAAANAERAQRGLQPLRWDAALYRRGGQTCARDGGAGFDLAPVPG